MTENVTDAPGNTSSFKQSSPSKKPEKKRKTDASGLSALIQAGANDPPTNSSWRKHLKVVTITTAEGLVKIARDSRYPLQRVLNGVLPLVDANKATTICFGPAMAAIKRYGIYSSFMAHLLETSFRKSVEERGRCEEDLARAQRMITEL